MPYEDVTVPELLPPSEDGLFKTFPDVPEYA
jgi:hypothetical protein